MCDILIYLTSVSFSLDSKMGASDDMLTYSSKARNNEITLEVAKGIHYMRESFCANSKRTSELSSNKLFCLNCLFDKCSVCIS